MYRSGSNSRFISEILDISKNSVEGKIDRLQLSKQERWKDNTKKLDFNIKKINALKKSDKPTKHRKFNSSESWRCLANDCRNTKQPGTTVCAEHTNPHKNRRSNMSTTIGEVVNPFWG